MKHLSRKVVFLLIIIIIGVSLYQCQKSKTVEKPIEFEPMFYQIGDSEIGEPISYVLNH